MRIQIAARLHPFSHTPGISCLVPKTCLVVQVFPTLLRVYGQEIRLPFKGPITDFTVEQDLEKGCVRVFGKALNGFVRYLIYAQEKSLHIDFEKPKREQIRIPLREPEGVIPKERLSLGMHKSQDWDLVCRRGDLREIFPAWLLLSQMLPSIDETAPVSLLQNCRAARKDRNKLHAAFLNLFHAHFGGILVPRLFDELFQGLSSEEESFPKDLSPFFLLKESGDLIRSLFFQEEKEEFALLPCLPPEFHAGRFIHVASRAGDEIHFEWSKKLLRRALIRPSSQRRIHLILQKDIQRFRLRRSFKERGQIIQCGEPLLLESGQTIYLDRFQK